METQGITKAQLVNQLIKIGHGDLSIYKEVGIKAVQQEPELFAHLIAWNATKGEVRDSKVAFPVIALHSTTKDDELFENAAAHLCKLDPKDLLRACRFHRELEVTKVGGAKYIKIAVNKYLREREKKRKWWDSSVLQHRQSMKSLYAMYHIRPSSFADSILFKREYPANSVFSRLRELKHMAPQEAAGTILNYNIPFLTAVGALGGIKGKHDIVIALMERMTGNELINNTRMLEKFGVFENEMLKAAYDASITRMKTQKKQISTLKAGKAAQSLGKTEAGKHAAKKLEQIQEQRLEKLGGIEGDWLVLGDRSGSMHSAIEVARHTAALIAQQVKGAVHLILFNTSPVYFDVTGKTLEEIQELTKRLHATGGTSIGCGVEYLAERNLLVNGIVVCSDGGDNTRPLFHDAYQKYVSKFSIEPTVYLLHVPGEENRMANYCSRSNIDLQITELGSRVDYYSLPNLIKTLRTSKYSLLDEIMESKLLKFTDVFQTEEFRRESA